MLTVSLDTAVPLMCTLHLLHTIGQFDSGLLILSILLGYLLDTHRELMYVQHRLDATTCNNIHTLLRPVYDPGCALSS